MYIRYPLLFHTVGLLREPYLTFDMKCSKLFYEFVIEACAHDGWDFSG